MGEKKRDIPNEGYFCHFFWNLKGYIIDKNERKIKKNNLELQLSEKEVDFLIKIASGQPPTLCLSRSFAFNISFPV